MTRTFFVRLKTSMCFLSNTNFKILLNFRLFVDLCFRKKYTKFTLRTGFYFINVINCL